MADPTVTLATPVDRAWFIERMQDAGYPSLRSLAPKAGLNVSQLSRTLRGFRRLQIADARRLAALIRVPVASLLGHAGGGKRNATSWPTPLVGLVDGNGRVTASWDETKGDHVAGPERLPQGAAALMVEAGINQGAILYVGPAVPPAGRTGYAVVGPEGGDEVVGYLRASGRGATLLGWPGMSGVRRRDVRVAWVRPVLWMQMA